MMKNDSSIQQQYDRLLQEKKSLTERINTQNQTLSKLRELNKSITERIQREKKFFQEQLQNKTFKKKDDFKKDLSNFRKQKESIVKIYY
jgi:predicted  nucleic acid-binding Zn-ribbon protein